jgi:hypothetical protein
MNNYRQALKKSMANLKITDIKVFTEWLEEEWVYLKGLVKEPI